MERLEEIKERVKQRNEHYVYESEYEIQCHHDIEYLLSLIDQYKTALEDISKEVDVDSDIPTVLMGKAAIEINRMKTSAKQALESHEERGGLVNPDGGDYPLKWMSQPSEKE